MTCFLNCKNIYYLLSYLYIYTYINLHIPTTFYNIHRHSDASMIGMVIGNTLVSISVSSTIDFVHILFICRYINCLPSLGKFMQKAFYIINIQFWGKMSSFKVLLNHKRIEKKYILQICDNR